MTTHGGHPGTQGTDQIELMTKLKEMYFPGPMSHIQPLRAHMGFKSHPPVTWVKYGAFFGTQGKLLPVHMVQCWLPAACGELLAEPSRTRWLLIGYGSATRGKLIFHSDL